MKKNRTSPHPKPLNPSNDPQIERVRAFMKLSPTEKIRLLCDLTGDMEDLRAKALPEINKRYKKAIPV
jgi:hypothetical protein